MVRRSRPDAVDAQFDIAKRVTDVFQFKFKQYDWKHHYFADFFQYGKLISCVIVKNRDKRYPEWMIGEEQVIEARKLAEKAGVRLWAVLRFPDDSIWFARLSGPDKKWRRALGRTNWKERQGDRKAEEMCNFVPMTEFRKLPESWSWE